MRRSRHESPVGAPSIVRGEAPPGNKSESTQDGLTKATLAGAGAYDANYFTRVYGGFTSGRRFSQTTFDRLRDARIRKCLERYAPQVWPRALLDIGCGFGWLLERVGDSFERYGVDISPHAISQAQGLVQDATVRAADVEEGIPFARRFEAIVAVNVLEHLLDPGAIIRRIFDCLIPGGVTVVHLPTIDNSLNRAIYKATYARDDTHVYRPSSHEVRDRFQAIGFELVTHSRCPHAPAPLSHLLPWHPAYLAVFRRPETLERRL